MGEERVLVVVPRIEDEESAWERRPYQERYFENAAFEGDNGGKYSLLTHSNTMMVVTLGPQHPILEQNMGVTSVHFKVGECVVSGKGKSGAQVLNETSILCQITCSNGEVFHVGPGFKGKSKLLEVNDHLKTRPELVKDAHLGYIALLAPFVKGRDKGKGNGEELPPDL